MQHPMRGLNRTRSRRRQTRLTAVIRKAFYFRPLALVLAFLLLRIPFVPQIGSVQPAYAGVDPCASSADRILQDICPNGVPDTTLMNFEQETVDAWLTAHGMPLSNADLIYQHGRGDLRSVIRAAMFARILAIIAKSSAGRTATEQYIFEWFRQRVQDKEVGVVQYAVDERDRWENDPCHWDPDPDIADAYGLYYTGGAACSGGLLSLFSTQVQVPQKSYFLTAGFKETYGSGIAASPGGSEALRQTSESLVSQIGISVLGSAVAALGFGVLAGVANAAIFGAAAGVAKAATAIAAAATAAGVFLIVFFAVLIGFIAAFELAEAQKTLDELAELDTQLTNTQSKFVSLSALAGNDEGMTKLVMTFVEATLPEFSSSSTLPSRESDDLLFYVGLMGAPPSMVTADLTYQDWEGDTWTATPYHGFLVQHGSENGNPVTSFSPIMRILDPDTGEKLTADLVGTNFLVTRIEPDPDQENCMVNPFTGVSDAGDLSDCKAYVASAINLRDENGVQKTVSVAALPSFTSLPSTTFTEGVAKTFDVTATGPPLPTITVVGSLPAGFTFLSASDTGLLELSYDGTTMVGASEHSVLFRATNPRGSVDQNFTIQTGTELAFTSAATPTFFAGTFVSFLITTSGDPTPEIHLPTTFIPGLGDVIFQCLPCGLSLTDNGDGTATVSGIPTLNICFFNPCNITAENGIDTATQNFLPQVVKPPVAQLASDSSTTFFAGVLNSFDFATQGALTPVTISLPCADAPGWVNLNDHGNGTATLFGLPPFGTDGVFSFRVDVLTAGDFDHVTDCANPNFTIFVSNVPTFLSPNRIQFGPPPITGTTLVVTTNQNSGSISLEGSLPAGVSFNPNEPNPNDGKATIGGFPELGTGGVYPLVLSMTNSAGTGSQNLRLIVKEAPTFEGAFDSTVFYIGQANSFAVQTTGFPKLPELIGNENPVELAMHIDLNGALPPGVSFTDTNQFDIPTGTGVFGGMPDTGSEGTYPLTLTAGNGVLPDAMLDFTLYVAKAGDVNRDGVVDKRDADLIRESLNESTADPDFDHLIDTNNDGVIDGRDLKFVLDACPDPDGDGACESFTEDRDGDGIPDAEDYDPTGYLYDVHTGEILSGGKVTVTPAPASMPFDGSGGFYQFFVAPGETVYTLSFQLPRGCHVTCPRLDPPPLDPMMTSVVLGSSEVGNTGLLASPDCADNPHALTLRLGETGDEVLLNNIALDCGPAQAPAVDARGFLLALLALFGVAAFGFRRRRGGRDGSAEHEVAG